MEESFSEKNLKIGEVYTWADRWPNLITEIYRNDYYHLFVYLGENPISYDGYWDLPLYKFYDVKTMIFMNIRKSNLYLVKEANSK